MVIEKYGVIPGVEVCPDCNGSGYNENKRTCKMCGGTGEIKVPPLPDEEAENDGDNSSEANK